MLGGKGSDGPNGHSGSRFLGVAVDTHTNHPTATQEGGIGGVEDEVNFHFAKVCTDGFEKQKSDFDPPIAVDCRYLTFFNSNWLSLAPLLIYLS